MARGPRKHGQTGFYHIILRGNDRQDIFFEDVDRILFIKKMNKYIEETGLSMYAFCLMNNHVHILVGNADSNMALFVKKLACSYVYYFNHKYDRIGHLFQSRYKSEPVDTAEYFKTVYRYILQNPEKLRLEAGISYRWSSLNWEGKLKSLNVRYVDDVFGSKSARKHFITLKNDDLCMENISEPICKYDDDAVNGFIKTAFNIEHVHKLHECSREEQKERLHFLKKTGFSVSQLSRITEFSRYFITLA